MQRKLQPEASRARDGMEEVDAAAATGFQVDLHPLLFPSLLLSLSTAGTPRLQGLFPFPPRGRIYSVLRALSCACFPPRASALRFPPPRAHMLSCRVQADAQSHLGDAFRRKATTYDLRSWRARRPASKIARTPSRRLGDALITMQWSLQNTWESG